jgi:hypothetical protein
MKMTTTTNHRLYGQVHHTSGTTGKAKAKGKPKGTQPKRSRAKKGLGANQRVALLLGGVAALLVALSVYHLTCGIATLTGSPLFLALLLAVGIDIGLVASEVAEVLGHADDEVKRWSRVYMAMATVMSMLLNSYEFCAHSPDHLFSKGLSIGFGLALPVMVWVLARQGMKLWAMK